MSSSLLCVFRSLERASRTRRNENTGVSFQTALLTVSLFQRAAKRLTEIILMFPFSCFPLRENDGVQMRHEGGNIHQSHSGFLASSKAQNLQVIREIHDLLLKAWMRSVVYLSRLENMLSIGFSVKCIIICLRSPRISGVVMVSPQRWRHYAESRCDYTSLEVLKCCWLYF